MNVSSTAGTARQDDRGGKGHHNDEQPARGGRGAVPQSPRCKRDQAATRKYESNRRVGSELAHGSTNGSRKAPHQIARREPPAEIDHDIPFAESAATGTEWKTVAGVLRQRFSRALTGFARR